VYSIRSESVKSRETGWAVCFMEEPDVTAGTWAAESGFFFFDVAWWSLIFRSFLSWDSCLVICEVNLFLFVHE